MSRDNLSVPSSRIKTGPIRGGIQNISDWCRLLYSSCGSAKHLLQQTKLWIRGSTATFCRDCVKTCEDVAPNFGENRPGCFTTTTPRLTLPSSPSSFWRNTKWLSLLIHRTPLIWYLVISSYFQKWNWSWKDAGLITLRKSRPNHRGCLTLWQKRTSRKRSRNRGDGRTDAYMREETTLRVMVTDRPYGDFYDFYGVSPKYFEYTPSYVVPKRRYLSNKPCCKTSQKSKYLIVEILEILKIQ
jgi:hypothetical protein